MILFGVFRGMLRSLIRLVLLVTFLALAWYFRDPLVELGRRTAARWSAMRGAGVDAPGAVSAELAAVAQARLDDLKAGTAARVALGTDELQSLLQFRYRGLLPAFVDSPRVTLEDEHLRIRVRVPLTRIPQSEEWGEITQLLPDTTELDVRGQLLPAENGRIAFAVDEVSAHRIPLPRRLVPRALALLGRTDEPGLPPDAISIPLPPGATAAYIRSDSLVLLTRRAGTGD